LPRTPSGLRPQLSHTCTFIDPFVVLTRAPTPTKLALSELPPRDHPHPSRPACAAGRPANLPFPKGPTTRPPPSPPNPPSLSALYLLAEFFFLWDLTQNSFPPPSSPPATFFFLIRTPNGLLMIPVTDLIAGFLLLLGIGVFWFFRDFPFFFFRRPGDQNISFQMVY